MAINVAPTDPTKFDTLPTVIGGMAPCIFFADARHLSNTRTETLNWNFGDAADHRLDPVSGLMVDANSALTAQVVAHWYLNPNTYSATCKVNHVNGTSSVHSFKVVVVPDTRTQVYFAPNGSDSNNGSDSSPYLSSAKFCTLAQTSNIHIHLAPGMTIQLNGTMQLGSNVVIDGSGSTIMLSKGGYGFAGAPGRTSDVLIHHCNFDCAGYDGEQLAVVRGTRVSFLDCTLNRLNRGFEVDGIATDCVLLQGIVQMNGSTILSQCFYIGACTRVVELWNTLLGSVDESPDRADLSSNLGNLSGWTIEYCQYSQPSDAKAAVTRRIGQDGVMANSVVNRADLSFNVGSASPVTFAVCRVSNTVVRRVVMNFGTSNATCRVRPGVIGITFRGNTINRNGGPAFSIVPDPVGTGIPIQDVILDSNVVVGQNVRLLFQPVAANILTLTNNKVNGVVVSG